MHLRTVLGRRAVAVPALAAALAAPLLCATPAAAASTGTVSRADGIVTFVPNPGTNNRVTFYTTNNSTYLRVSDPNGITAGAGCRQTSAFTATCGTTAGITGITATGGDGDDRLALEQDLNIPADLNGGPGRDILVGGSADDHLEDPDGWPVRPDRATMRGFSGNDVIVSRNGGYDRVECETGFDTVTADPRYLDSTASCETVIRG